MVEDHSQGEQHEEGNHYAEQAHSFGQRESEDSVGKQLLFEGWVSGVTNN